MNTLTEENYNEIRMLAKYSFYSFLNKMARGEFNKAAFKQKLVTDVEDAIQMVFLEMYHNPNNYSYLHLEEFHKLPLKTKRFCVKKALIRAMVRKGMPAAKDTVKDSSFFKKLNSYQGHIDDVDGIKEGEIGSNSQYHTELEYRDLNKAIKSCNMSEAEAEILVRTVVNEEAGTAIGKEKGISKQRVNQYKLRAIKKLKEELA